MFCLEPLGEDDFEFRYEMYCVTIKPYLDRFFDWDEAQHRDMIRPHLVGSGVQVAIVVDGVRVGAAQIDEADGRITLHQIAILPSYQGAGIGTAVIRSLMERAAETNRVVQLSVFTANTGAQRLYERLGFVTVETTDRDLTMRYNPNPA